MYNEHFSKFIDGAYMTGFPYAIEVSAYNGPLLEFTSYHAVKTMRDAWIWFNKNVGRFIEDLPEEADGMNLYGTIWKASDNDILGIRHDLICNIGVWDRGSWRDVNRATWTPEGVDYTYEHYR